MKRSAVTTNKTILFVARTYPPLVGGMERLNFELLENLKVKRPVITIINHWPRFLFPLFLLSACFRVLFHARKAECVFLSDATLAVIGFMAKKILGKRVLIYVPGLDVTYASKLYQKYLKIFFKPDKIICASRYSESLLQKRGFLNTIVITPGLDHQRFNIQPVAPQPDLEKKYHFNASGKKVILTVGRLVKRKGVAWFVDKVMPLLPPDIIFLVAGSGNQKNVIEAKINEKNLSCRVFLLGYVEPEDLPSFYQLARIFIMPNLRIDNDPEGFGIATIEAAAWGLPVVAADADGIPDAIKDNINGRLVRSGDASEFTRIIIQLLSDEKNRRWFGQEARRYTLDNFSWENKINDFIKVINDY